MKLLCNECSHNKICKFKKSYLSTVDSLSIKIPTPFDLELKCPHFSSNVNSYYNHYNLTCTNTTDSLCTAPESLVGITTSATATTDYEQLTFEDLET
jgi:hypothetical protein